MKYVIWGLIGYCVMYLVIWLHEIGHSIVDYKYGVKDSIFKVNVKPYIFFSTPGDLNLDVWNSLQTKQYVAVAYAGIVANAIWAAITGIVLYLVTINNTYLLMALWLFMTLHMGEIFSYLLIGSIYLVSDMEIIAQVMPKLRIPNIIMGVLTGALYVVLLLNIPSSVQPFVVSWNVVTVGCMCGGRIAFSLKAKRQ